ncbi:MAG TPA: asparagine synthase (glutamine-hydrolyzing) [Saprospiraceae bacterium]|nr:asparagine synthase (glutamine-hydrolyzing) [Saprospiraceae bacterium]
MCGIAGIINIGHEKLKKTAIQAMTDAIAHRGPDAEGIFVNKKIALGHRRLSIIDLSETANQPMADFSGRYIIIFNGEIYNYLEIKADLPSYPFRTQSDSEVILAAFSKWGPDCLSRINGMFAFAIWDKDEESLFVARDRLGKKPFYYYLSAEHFVFSSEIRSMLASGIIPRELDKTHLAEYFLYQAPLGSHTLVKNIKELHAGHYAIIKNGQFQEIPYWEYKNITPATEDYEAAKKKVKELFIDSVRLRLVSDVPIGAFLSGGIDSSLVVACMAELVDGPIDTYNISFREKKYDESVFAQLIATKYHTHHHRIIIKPEEFLDSMDEILQAMDSPSGDGPNTYLVSKHTRKAGIKVALSGLGGDELFAGYNYFLMYHKLIRNKRLTKFPLAIRRRLAKGLLSFNSSRKFNKLASILNLKTWDLPSLYPVFRSSGNLAETNSLLSEVFKNDEAGLNLKAIDKDTSWMGNISKATIGEIELYTRDVLLRDTDQMAMAHALEVRAPFFDYRLVEYVLSLPDEYKYPTTPKKMLVESLAPRIPLEIVNRQKMGFSLPMKGWLQNELCGMADQKIKYLADRKEFNGDQILHTWNGFRTGDPRILWTSVWNQVVLSDWLQRNNL